MKVTLVNHSDIKGGASMASLRLLDALQAEGVEARMLVKSVDGQSRPDIAVAGSNIQRKLCFIRERAHIFVSNGYNRRHLFDVSTGECGLPLHKHPWIKDADIVVLNWFNQGMMSLDEIKRIADIGKPMVWVMHDMWAMTGICHLAYGCSKFCQECQECPYLGSSRSPDDLSHQIFLRKRHVYDAVGDAIYFVAVSRWLADQAKKSALLAGRYIEVIHNAFPVDDYSISPKRTLTEIGLPDDSRKLIVMCAARLDDPNKDLPRAVDAISMFEARNPGRARFVLCGNIRRPEILREIKMPYHWFGSIDDGSLLADIYAHASAVISTSPFETLGYTLIEGMAAGAVPVSYGKDGRNDVIDHLHNGYIADRSDRFDIVNGLEWALTCKISRHGQQCSVTENFAGQHIAAKYMALFNKILNKR